MIIRDTQELNDHLKKSMDCFDQYLNMDKEITFSQYFTKYMAQNGMSKTSIIKKSTLNRTYAYQILNGLKKPGRDKILALCLAAEMPVEEIQRVLNISKKNILYARDSRDAAILSCINHGIYNLNQVNEFLFKHEFDVLE